MRAEVISRVESEEDRAYYLGDLAYGKRSKHYVKEYNTILNGNIIFIKGNQQAS
ncbi:MAG: hypothetical protein PXY39_15225 [archaeon]|nr:hypothetical protein [archaeon]